MINTFIMKKLIFILLAFITFSCNDNQIESDINPDRNVIQKHDLQSSIDRLESIGLRHKAINSANLRKEACAPETEGSCTSYAIKPFSLDVPGANGRPNCTVTVSYNVQYCLVNGQTTMINITDLEIDYSGCVSLNTYWDELSYGEREESISSFEFQVSLMLEKILVEGFGITASCDDGGFVQVQYIKNLCYSYCTIYGPKGGKTYEKSSCGFICCNRKTNYCINSGGDLEQGTPAYIIQDDGSCEKTSICPGDVPFPNPCTQNDCYYEVRIDYDDM